MSATRCIRYSALSIATTVALHACTPDPNTNPAFQHVEISYENDERQICAGSVSHLEQYIERAFDFLESTAAESFSVPVRVTHEVPCPWRACYRPDEGAVYIRDLDALGERTTAVLRHELTHAVIDHSWGQSASFFEEGLAESLSRTLDRSWSAPEPLEPVGSMLGGVPAEVEYTAAAYFTRFLIDTRGLAPFKQLFQGARGRSREEIEALMAEIYGESFATLEAEYLSGPPRCQYQLDVCDPESAESVGTGFHLTRAASCDDPDFYGSIGSEDLDIATQQTLAVEASGTYRLRIAYDVPPLSADYPRSQVILTRCSECDEQSVQMFHRTDETLELEAGLYALEIVMPFATVVSIDLEPVDP